MASKAALRAGQRPTRFASRVLIATVFLAVTVPLLAANDVQSVTPNPASQNANPSQAVSVTFVYNATSTGTTGLGLRIHFDSSRLTPQNPLLTSIFPGTPGGPMFVMGPSAVVNDDGNEDGDASTDKIVVLAWVHIMSGFPGGPFPKDLFTINFTTSAGFAAATRVNISAVDTAAGYSFQSTSAVISPPGAPTPTPLPPTPTPPPGTVNAELDIDLNGQVGTFSDALLFFRYKAGFRGTDLTNNAVAPNCKRCTAPQIESYILFILPQLDIDLNGQVQTFSDALLVFRYKAGFRGTDLTNNAVAGNCTPPRCTAPGIEAYILGLTQ